VALQALMYAFQAPVVATLRGMQRARDLFVVQVIFSVATLTVAATAALTGTAVTVAWALSAAGAVMVGGMVVACYRALSRAPAGRPA
jgi:Na+-driven multidrug efflux pump